MVTTSLQGVLRCFLGVCVLISVLACAPVSPPLQATNPLPSQESTSTPPSQARVPTSDPVAAGIQQTLDRYTQAYNHNDAALMLQLIDPTNLPFRRFVVARFDDFQASLQHDRGILPLHVLSTQRRADGFVRAHIQAGTDRASDWLFRQVGTDWRLAEPTVAQIGAPTRVVHGRFTFVTYPWADDVNATIIAIMERAQHNVVRQLGADAAQPVTVDIKPIYGLHPYEQAFYVAYYTPGRSPTGPDRIELFVPNSYMFGFYNQHDGWEQALETTLTHEYTHMVHTRAFKNVGYNTTWMPEGLAEYVAGHRNAALVREAVQHGAIIPIIDMQSPVNKQDLMHMTTLSKDRGLAYGFAQSLVQYIIEKHGGLTTFWDLATAYDASHDLDTALQTVVHLHYDAFDAGWRAWLRATY